jgi:hypothetical protein
MPATDDFPNPSAYGSADDFRAITPSDSVDLPFRCRGIYCGGAGVVALLAKDGTTSVPFTVTAGMVLMARTTRVMLTGTTATLLVALR